MKEVYLFGFSPCLFVVALELLKVPKREASRTYALISLVLGLIARWMFFSCSRPPLMLLSSY